MPSEANAVLIVDPNAVLPFAIAFELLQAIPGRDLQVFQFGRSVKHGKLSLRNASGRGTPGFPGSPYPLGFGVGEALDHTRMVTENINNVKRYYWDAMKLLPAGGCPPFEVISPLALCTPPAPQLQHPPALWW
jgi:hypothetical protein